MQPLIYIMPTMEPFAQKMVFLVVFYLKNSCVFSISQTKNNVKRFHIENGLMCIVFSFQAFLSQIIALLYISQEIVYFFVYLILFT